ncbi:MAG: hypothetical protein AB9836_04760 [Aminipila sp.]
MNRPKNFIEFYRYNGIYKDEHGYYSIITGFGRRYWNKTAVKLAISQKLRYGIN